MADEREKLMFQMGFDLESAAKDVINDWPTYAKRIQKAIDSTPMMLRIIADDKHIGESTTRMASSIKSIEQKLPQLKLKVPDTVDFEQEIERLKVSLKDVDLGALTKEEQTDLYLYIRQLEAASKQLRELNKAKQLSDKSHKALREASAEQKRADALAKSALAEQRSAKIATERARQSEINTRSANNEAIAVERKRKATASAELAELRLANAQKKGAKATNAQNAAFRTQSSYISRLIQRLGIYTGIYAAAGMLRDIRETTAEFELQEVALGAIIQDAHEAQVLFSQIKAAAVESPYQIKELVDYTKQLAAYGFEQNELFDTTMKLADISAGLGADMSRIILAVGQVSAATVLKGTELRQFTELGIPMVELLAEKFTQLRGEVVTTGEVFEMISDKAVSFKMVEEILNDLTSAGGMFYDMQRKQAETLAGQWSNLKDSIAIAYDEIGNTGTVRGAMEGVISLLKSMVDNWERTAAVLSGLVTGIATYVAAVKSAALVEALRNRTLADNIKLVRASVTVQPKWVAAIIGETRAKTLNLAMTKALRIARLKEVAATNVASKAFWRLTAAMMSNPYAIVIAAIAALGFTIFNMAKNTRTAEESIDDLNESVASLSKLNNSVKPLVDELDALSSKAEKTADEQKRLNQVTRELADMYPTTISAVRKYGEEIDVTTEKVKALYEAELKASQEATKILIKENEDRLEAIRKSIELRGQQLIQGGVTKYAPYSGTPYIEPFTDEQASKFSKEFQELQAEAKRLEAAIKAAKIELGLLPSEAQQNIEAFGAWKAELEKFILSYKTADGQDIQFFDDQQIDRFNNLNDALAETVKIRKENTDAVAKYNETLKSTTISEDTRTRITQERANAQAHIDTADAIIKHFNAYSLLQEAKGKEDRTPLQILNEEVSLLEKVYAKYKEFLKYMSSADAKAKTEEYFADTIGSLRFGAAFDTAKLKEMLTKYQDAARSLPESDKTVLELGFKVDDVSWQETLDDMKERVAELADAVARSKEAKDFYDKMLGMTGDRQLSADLTMSVYGGVGDDLKENIKAQLEEAFEGVNIKPAFDGDKIDWSQLNDLVESIPIESKREEARKLVKEGIKDNSKLIQSYVKLLMEYDDVQQKRVNIANKTAKDIATIEEGLRLEIEGINNNPDIQNKGGAITEATDRADKAIAAIRAREKYELSKLSGDYIRFFSAINSMSSDTANTIRTELRREVFEAFSKGAISAEDLRKELKAIDTQFNKLNENSSFFAAYMNDGFDGFISKMRESGDELDALAAKMKGLGSVDDLSSDEQSFINKMLNIFGGKGQKSLSDLAKSFNGDMSKMGEAVAQVGGKMQAMFSNASRAIAIVDTIIKTVHQSILATQQVIDQINSMRNEDNQIGGWFKYISDFDQYAFSGWEKLKSGDVAGATADVIGSIISIFQNIQADKIKKLNEDIEDQEDLLKELEYQHRKLEKAAESTFGTEYIDNYRERLELLQAEAEAYAKQIEAEQSKGKDADPDAIEDYEEARQDTLDKLDEAQKEIAERMLGTDLGSAARSFAQAWLEAYKEFGNTSDAIGKKFEEMIDNMLVESAIAGVMKTALEPVFDLMKDMDIYDEDWIKNFNDTVAKAKENALVGSELVANALEQGGILSREMGENLSGISKDIATASEESILGLAAGINTQNFYISQIHAAVLRMEMLMQSGGTGVNIQDLVTIQNQHLAHLPNIAANTASTLAECRSILAEVRRVADGMDRVITPNGTPANYQVHTTLS